jgi:hypothetical protein
VLEISQSISSSKFTTSYSHSTPVILNLVVCLSDDKKLMALGKVPVSKNLT